VSADEQRIYRALIVDDEPAAREATARAMADASFWCDTAADGAEALAKYRESRHDLVVTDLRMPGMHGYALTVELLKDAQPPRIVVLTGLAEPNLVKDLYSRGVDDVVSKPVDVRVFATKMASIFERNKWRESFIAAQQALPPTSGHSLVAHIEHMLDRESAPVPEQLEKLFQTASTEVSDPPQAMITFLERMFDSPDGQGDRRRTQRASLLATITAIPLSPSFEPCGEPFKAAARDASEGGISLLHTRAVTATHLALRWQSLAAPARQINMLLHVDRCHPMGPFYEVAGQFVPRG
jgi:CheY-like chemotaxis protein